MRQYEFPPEFVDEVLRIPENELLAELLFKVIESSEAAWNPDWYIDEDYSPHTVRANGWFDLLKAADQIIAAGWSKS